MKATKEMKERAAAAICAARGNGQDVGNYDLDLADIALEAGLADVVATDTMARAAHEAYFDDGGPSDVELACMRNAVAAALDCETAPQPEGDALAAYLQGRKDEYELRVLPLERRVGELAAELAALRKPPLMAVHPDGKVEPVGVPAWVEPLASEWEAKGAANPAALLSEDIVRMNCARELRERAKGGA